MSRIKLHHLCTVSAAAFAAIGLAAPAVAQDTDAADQCTPEQAQAGTCTLDAGADQGADGSGGQSVLVTGSRIRRPNLESAVPITSIVGEDIFNRGENNIGESLNELPQLRASVSQQNVGAGIGIAGLNLLDLRGLGTVRTLVLVNGRRHVAADITNNAASVDINTIPSDLLDRVDIITGGNSAVYGSDAIAGVVNFVLKRNFEGLQIRGQAGISGEGFGGNQYVSAMYGLNFGDDRGNVTVHAEYYNQKRIFYSDLPWLRQVDGLVVVDSDPGGAVNGSDGVPDRVFVRDIRSSVGNFPSGAVPISYNAATQQCGVGVGTGAGGTGGVPFNCNFMFTDGGRLISQTGSRIGTGPGGTYVGGNGPNGREGILGSLYPSNERYNFNLLAHYAFSDALDLFAEAKWVRTNVIGGNAGPAFINGGFTQFDFRERIRLDNPFLNPADRTTLANAILASGCNTSTQVTCTGATGATGGPLTPAQQTQIANGTYRFQLLRTLLDTAAESGSRNELFQRDTYRLVGGLRGTFNEDWNYELSVNYGNQQESIDIEGFLDKQRFLLSLDSGRNPNTGQIQCRAQFDPASAVAYQNAALRADQNAFIASRLASDIAACVPYNPFGQVDNSAAAAYFNTLSHTDTETDQFVVLGFLGGDTSQFLELPGGPIRFAIGAEYRRETVSYAQDPFILTGATTNVVIPLFTGEFEAKEAFAELQIPLLRDMPFFHELTASAAARVSSYGGTVGTVWAYNAGIEWAPIRDLRFRGNYSRSVRAPNLSETAFPQVPNFANAFQDPCRAANIGTGTQFRPANCQADLGALLPGIANLANYSLPVITGSNPDLVAETADSWTIGMVAQPRFIPGLALSVDYYDITVNNVIVTLTAQQIADACYDQASLNNPFCAAFTRFRGPGNGPFGEAPGQILGNSLIQAGVNFARRVRRGIDVNLNYRANLTDDVRLNTGLVYTHSLKNSNFENTTDPTFENRIMGELGDPVDEFRFTADLTYRDFTFGYQLQYIGPMWINLYEDFNSLGGRSPQNADWADVEKFPAVFYHDIRFEWNVNGSGIGRDLRFLMGVENLLNTHPAFGLNGAGAGPGGNGNAAIYDVRGRTFYAGFRARF